MYIILVYDISGQRGGQKVLTKVFKVCKKYLSHIQHSVFEGEITPVKVLMLQQELGQLTRNDLDSIIIFKSRNERWLEKEMWGMKEDKTSNFL